LNLWLELWLSGQREDGTLQGGHVDGEVEIGSLGVLGANFEAVLEDAVNDPADTEGGLDDVRGVLFFLDCSYFLLDFDTLGSQFKLLAIFEGYRYFTGVGQLLEVGGFLLFGPRTYHQLNSSGVLFENLFVGCDNDFCDFDWLLKCPCCLEINFTFLSVPDYIKAAPVSMPCDFDPAIAGLDLCIPAILGVMSHFFGTMLPVANAFRLDTTTSQKTERASHKVAHCLVADNSLFKSICHSKICNGSNHLFLIFSCPERQDIISY
jgi:hypothetical protein